MKLFRRYMAALVAALFFSVVASVAVAAEASATDSLRIAVDSVIELLADKELDRAKRRQLVVEQIRATFDFTAMSRFIVGKYWKRATQEQRDTFVERFTIILEHTYIGRIEAYSDEKVRYVAEKRRGGKAKVDTLVVGGNIEIPINYKLYLKGGKWYVYDISVEGVSLVRNYKDTYKGIIRKDGVEGLLEKMAKKVEEMVAGEKS